MTTKLQAFPTISPPCLFSITALNRTPKSLDFIHPFPSNYSVSITHLSWKKTVKPVMKKKRMKLGIYSMAASSADGKGEALKWAAMIFRSGDVGERILRLIAGATSSPICQFVPSPVTFLHSLDPRIKLVWLLALVILPARSHIIMRLGLVIYLALLSIWVLPKHVWMDQLGRVAFLSLVLFVMLGLGSDGVPPLVQLRTPPPAMTGLPSLPMSFGGYSYSIMKLGPLQFTRKGLSVASTSACLTFTVFQSASLCLTTTTPEQLASALRWFMLPLTFVGVPVSEIILTLLLSLRFINLVFDEVRNAALGVVARRILWRELTIMETLDVFLMFVRRIFKNIFSHAEQISQVVPLIFLMWLLQAMIVRGFRGDSRAHKIYFFSDSSIGMADVASVLCLLGLIGAAILSEQFFV